MRIKKVIACIYVLSLVACSSFAEMNSDERAAHKKGAYLQIIFKVVDDKDNPVINAYVQAGYSSPEKGGHWSKGYTDTNGLYTAKGHTEDDMNWTITKDQFYASRGRCYAWGKATPQAIDGKWQPWNPTIDVVLKPKKNTVAMYAKNVDTKIPLRNEAVGFDCEAGDWVAPHGKGHAADLTFAYSDNIQDYLTFSNQLVIACNGQMSGLFQANKDSWSECVSAYEAPDSGYQEQVVLTIDRTKMKVLKNEEIGEGEYLFFRTRTTVDDKGQLVNARYGKIYGAIIYGGYKDELAVLRFTYYFNPTPNDRNLEFDPKKNLLPPLKPHDKVPRP